MSNELHGAAPKVEEFVKVFLSRLAGLTEEQASNVAETLSHMLRPYFPPASQTPPWVEEFLEHIKWMHDHAHNRIEQTHDSGVMKGYRCIPVDSQLNAYLQGQRDTAAELLARAREFKMLATPASTARTDGPKYKHKANCLWATELPTGAGHWGCDCGLDKLLLDLEDYEGVPQAEPPKEEKAEVDELHHQLKVKDIAATAIAVVLRAKCSDREWDGLPEEMRVQTDRIAELVERAEAAEKRVKELAGSAPQGDDKPGQK